MATRESTGIIIEATRVPAGFCRFLEQKGHVAIATRTVDGLYIEPLSSLDAILLLCDRAGIETWGVRRAGSPASWQRSMYGAITAGKRLRSVRTAEWLPTLPVA